MTGTPCVNAIRMLIPHCVNAFWISVFFLKHVPCVNVFRMSMFFTVMIPVVTYDQATELVVQRSPGSPRC
jgi:hypothetical protein